MTQTMEVPKVEVHFIEGDDGKVTPIVALGALAGVGVVGVLAGKVAHLGPFAKASHNETKVDGPTSDAAEALCKDSSFSPEAGNATAYTDEAFLPKGVIKDSDTAQTYINSLFDKDGPLSAKIDPISLAAVQSVITKPAHDGKATNPEYSYTGAFADTVAAYGSENGLDRAEADCAATHDTLVATAEYNANWAQEGATVVRVTALRNADYELVGMEFQEVVTTDTLKGVELKLRETNKDLDDFYSVLVAPDGKMYIQGPTPEQGKKVSLEQGEIPQGTTQHEQQANQGGGNENQGTNEGNTGEGGSAGPNGTNPEAGPGGSTESPGGPGGSTSTTGGEGTTTTTGGSGTTTSTTRPTTTTTEATTTTTTRATTTTTPKGTNPDCVPNPPFVYCPGGIEAQGVVLDTVAIAAIAKETRDQNTFASGNALTSIFVGGALLSVAVRRRLNLMKGVK